uniref:Uncharacterized protein n=1 Tax=Anopheles minimus TaxID=112268 RepID=A0A182W8W7_9DIPT
MFRIDSQLTGNYLFDGLWESVIKRCIIPEGQRQLTNDQLTAYIARKMRIVLRDCSFREELDLRPDEKDNAKANNFRMEGNRYMHPSSLERLCETSIYYNKSIACAEKGSEERAIATKIVWRIFD